MKGLLPWLEKKIADRVVKQRDHDARHPTLRLKSGLLPFLEEKVSDELVKRRARERNHDACKSLEIIEVLHEKSNKEYSYLHGNEHFLRAQALARQHGWDIVVSEGNSWDVYDDDHDPVTYLSLATRL